MNKLAGIWNVWDGDEHLKRSIELIKPHLDVVIVVYQNVSNSGELYEPTLPHELIDLTNFYIPALTQTAQWNETIKRNIGLQTAKSVGCTHFIQMDCDEMYFSEDFERAKEQVYVEQLDAEYRMLKVELEREVNKFELLRKQYNMRTRQLTDDITRKWFEVQRAKQESRA